MEEDFSTYGQIVPVGVKFNFDNPEEKRLDNFSMGQSLGYFDEQRKVLQQKQKQIEDLGTLIDTEQQKIQNASFLSDSAKEKARGTYLLHVKALKNHYKVPKSERGTDWYAEQHNLATNINSEVINNDLKNKELFNTVSQMAKTGEVSGSSFRDWYIDFKTYAENGEDYAKKSTKYIHGLPISAHENLLNVAQHLITTNGFKSYIRDGNGNITGIDPKEWSSFMENQLIPGAYEDAYAQFKQLPEQMQKMYMKEGDEVDGTKAYIRALFDNARYSFNALSTGKSVGGKKGNGNGGQEFDAYEAFWKSNLESAPVIQEGDDIDNTETSFYVPNTEMLRPSMVNGVIKEFRVKTNEPGKYIIIHNFRIDNANNVEYEKETDQRNKFTRMSAHREKVGNGYNMSVRMHDQSLVMSEEGLRTLIMNNLRPDKNGNRTYEIEDEAGNRIPANVDVIATWRNNLDKKFLSEYLKSGTYDILSSDLDGKGSVLPGSRTYRIGGVTLDGIYLNGLSRQVINSSYAQTTGVNSMGDQVNGSLGETFDKSDISFSFNK